MKTQNYLLIATLSSLAYYFGYKQDVLIFQILTWVVAISTMAFDIFALIGMSIINFEDDGQKIKDKFPSKFQMFVSVVFLVLNSWLFYGNQVFYFYIFTCIVSWVSLHAIYQKLKEHNYFN